MRVSRERPLLHLLRAPRSRRLRSGRSSTACKERLDAPATCNRLRLLLPITRCFRPPSPPLSYPTPDSPFSTGAEDPSFRSRPIVSPGALVGCLPENGTDSGQKSGRDGAVPSVNATCNNLRLLLSIISCFPAPSLPLPYPTHAS